MSPEWLSFFQYPLTAGFLLIFARIGGLLFTVPGIGSRTVGPRIRICLAVAIALLVYPTQFAVHPLEALAQLAEASSGETSGVIVPGPILGFHLFREATIGLILGLGLRILFGAVQVAGALISRAAGLTLAETLDPLTGESQPLISQFLFWIAIAVFFTIGGHRTAVQGLLSTYDYVPPCDIESIVRCEAPRPPASDAELAASPEALDNPFMTTSLFDAITRLSGAAIGLGLCLAAPVLTAVLTASILLAIVGRTIPQWNLMGVGLNLNALLVYGALALTIGTMMWAFQEKIPGAIDFLIQAITGS